MRSAFTLLGLFLAIPVVFAADPKVEATEAGNKYGIALQKTAKLLAEVKDEKTAAEAKPKIDNFQEEARDARRQLFLALAEVEGKDGELADSMVVFWKNVRQFHDTITAEFDRIGNNHKAAYKVLRETKLFTELEREYDGRAAFGAQVLTNCARTFITRSPDKMPQLADLAVYADRGQKALTDPWGFPYQMVTKPGKDGVSRTYVWTVSPYSGKKLGNPPPEEK